MGRLNGHQGEMVLGIRGEDIRLRNQASDTDGMDLLHAVITDTEVMGNENNLFFNFAGTRLWPGCQKMNFARWETVLVLYSFLPKCTFLTKLQESITRRQYENSRHYI